MTKHKENTSPLIRNSSYSNIIDKSENEEDIDLNINPY
jgi:hypothetical protein